MIITIKDNTLTLDNLNKTVESIKQVLNDLFNTSFCFYIDSKEDSLVLVFDDER